MIQRLEHLPFAARLKRSALVSSERGLLLKGEMSAFILDSIVLAVLV